MVLRKFSAVRRRRSSTSTQLTRLPRHGRSFPAGAPATKVEILEARTLLTGVLAAATEFFGVSSPHGIATGLFTQNNTPDVVVAGTNGNTGLPTVAVYLDGATTPIYNDLA